MVEVSHVRPEVSTTEESEAHDQWLRAKVAASLLDPRPAVPHDEVMAEMDAMIAAASASVRHSP